MACAFYGVSVLNAGLLGGCPLEVSDLGAGARSLERRDHKHLHNSIT